MKRIQRQMREVGELGISGERDFSGKMWYRRACFVGAMHGEMKEREMAQKELGALAAVVDVREVMMLMVCDVGC